MARLVILKVMLLSVAASAVFAQPLLRAYPTTETMIEGGNSDVLVMDAGKQLFSVEIPKNFGTQVHLETGSIAFTSLSSVSLITLQWTTNFPGILPSQDALKTIAKRKFPGAAILQPFPCATGYGPGRGFDLVRLAAEGLTVRIRDAYVSLPAGSVEFTFTCNGTDYDRQWLSFSRMLNSFRLRAENVTK